ncbi:MAG: DUF4089 domain-containing protein [Pseudanabaenales cyanobacterium]|nr:DUF4089 domain-containing protein [Pseudanabaenales cyanobacterium]MCG8364924.1 DUF4089 domain-containing protein [Pseudanabaenales cyanobacterium]
MSDSLQANQPSTHPVFSAEVYVQQTAQLLNLSIPPDQMASVVENFELIQAIAQPVLEFSLPDPLEAAPRFEP